MSLQGLIAQKFELERQRQAQLEDHKSKLKKIDSRAEEVESLIRAGKKGFDTDRVAMARGLVKVGEVNSGERRNCVQRFIRKLTEDPKWLESNYCGVKVYSGFGEQGEDHRHGYGPRHGSIVFRVELKKPSLSASEVDCVLWYLLNIEKIQEAEKQDA